jgi:hypothetical protein
LSNFDFGLQDFSDEDFFAQAAGLNARNLDRQGELRPLRTTATQSDTPRKGLTTIAVSDILQGTGTKRHDSFVQSALNQSLSSDLSGLMNTEGGASAIMGGRSALLPYDTIAGTVYDDGRMTGLSGADIGSIVTDATDSAATVPPITNIPAGSSPQSLGLQNGQIPTSMLVLVGNDGNEDEYLWANAAESYFSLKTAAAAAGITLGLRDCYRPVAKQQYFYDCYQQKLRGQANPCNNGNEAARPGTSNHGWGVSIDFADINYGTAKYNWLTTNAVPVGWKNDVRGEPWHWTYLR